MGARKGSTVQATKTSSQPGDRTTVAPKDSLPIARRSFSAFRTTLSGTEGAESRADLVSRWTLDSTKEVVSAIKTGQQFPSFVKSIQVAFAGATARLVDLRGINFTDEEFDGVDLSYCALDFCNIERCNLRHVQLQYTRLCGSYLKHSIFSELQASPIDAAGAHFEHIQFKNSFLQGSSFEGTSFSKSFFVDCIVGENTHLRSSLLKYSTDIPKSVDAKTSLKRTLIGKVVSDRRSKTVTVLVERRVRHDLYDKMVAKSSKYHVHDESGNCKLGDIVEISESRPISKLKSWTVTRLVTKGHLV